MRRRHEHDTEADDLADWLASGYARAYRTAFLLVRDARDAEEAVQEAYLRVWRFRASLPDSDGDPGATCGSILGPCNAPVSVRDATHERKPKTERRGTPPFGLTPLERFEYPRERAF